MLSSEHSLGTHFPFGMYFCHAAVGWLTLQFAVTRNNIIVGLPGAAYHLPWANKLYRPKTGSKRANVDNSMSYHGEERGQTILHSRPRKTGSIWRVSDTRPA